MPDFRAVFPEDAMKNCVFKAIILKGNADLVVFDNTGTDLNAHNVNDAIVELNDKIEHATDDYYTKEETDAKLELKADASELENYYTKSEFDSLLAEKADASSVYTKSETDDLLALKADADSVYTKQEADGLLDLKADESELANYYTKTESDNLLDAKADSNSVYTKQETNDLLSAKVDSTTLATDYYDKSDVNSLLSAKANADAVYTKEETDAEISALIDDAHVANNKAWSSEKISKELYDILPTEEASGAIANFNTSLALPLVSVKSAIVAIQEAGTPTPQSPKAISGVSAVSVYHCGGNFFNKNTVESGKLINASGNEVNYTDWNLSDYIEVIEDASYYLYGLTNHPNTNQDNLELFDENKNKVSFANVKTNEQPYTIPSGVKYIKCCVKNQDLDTAQFGVFQNLSYCPYSPYNEKYIINLGGTYYGGYVEQDKDGHRQLVVTHKRIDLSLQEWYYASNYNCWRLSNSISDAIARDNSTPANILAEEFTTVKAQGYTTSHLPNTICMNLNRDVFVDNSSTVDEPHGYLVYELDEPFTVELPDGEPIIAFNGVNNVWNDSGNTTAEYKLSIEEYVAKKIAEITDGNRSLNTTLLRASGDEREDITLPSFDELERETIEEPERDDSQR